MKSFLMNTSAIFTTRLFKHYHDELTLIVRCFRQYGEAGLDRNIAAGRRPFDAASFDMTSIFAEVLGGEFGFSAGEFSNAPVRMSINPHRSRFLGSLWFTSQAGSRGMFPGILYSHR